MTGKKRINSWEERNEFCERWNWEMVVSRWERWIKDAGVSTFPLFTPIRVFDPANPMGRESVLSWWPSGSIRNLHQELQGFLYKFPGRIGPVHPDFGTRRGEMETLRYLWRNRESVELMAAVLFSASLFSRMGSSRARYPETWPSRFGVGELYDWAKARMESNEDFYGWHYSCTQVLPYESSDWEYRLESMDALVRYLAEEHIALLQRYRPVVIEFSDSADPFIEKAVQQQIEAERLREQAWKRKCIDEQAQKAKELAELREKHPRFGEWGRVTNEELKRLVWLKPVTLIAIEFGVSDVAIAKRCKSAGIPKPLRGFWARVEAGKIPHPGGIPVMSSLRKRR
jgi:hypothetical protein